MNLPAESPALATEGRLRSLDTLRGFDMFWIIGGHAIAAYMMTRVFDFLALGDIFVGGLAKWTGDWHSFMRAVVAFAILFHLYRKRTFLKI